jgi:outer membrane protein OmpA-like peptidoglycan-associated protein
MARVRFIAFTVALALLAPAALAQQQYQDPTAIIRSLAPKKYLPEHSGRQDTAPPVARAVDLDVPFQLGSAALTDAARRQLDALAEALLAPELAEQRFLIAGHTDATGAADYNKALSERRAASVLRYLVEIHGVAEARLLAAGFGEERLKNTAHPAAAENRRVEVVALDPQAPAQPAPQPPAAPTPKKSRTEKITF